ncbi:MAG: phosphatase PAP2 family protein [Candidatus Coatesbacteria bacterium]|nr:phosphatase PAP2 family protein [Candidatus Coatesbacteria bacterium]
MELIISVDKSLFVLINKSLSSKFLDHVFILLSNPLIFIPVIAFFLIKSYKKNRKNIIILPLMILLTVSASDLTCTYLWKPVISKPRPAYTISNKPRLPEGSGGWFGFPSNHAANSTACFTIMALLLSTRIIYLLPFPLIISYSRIYLGKHYPLDVISGILWGLIIAFLFKELLDLIYKYIDIGNKEFKEDKNV